MPVQDKASAGIDHSFAQMRGHKEQLAVPSQAGCALAAPLDHLNTASLNAATTFCLPHNGIAATTLHVVPCCAVPCRAALLCLALPCRKHSEPWPRQRRLPTFWSRSASCLGLSRREARLAGGQCKGGTGCSTSIGHTAAAQSHACSWALAYAKRGSFARLSD
jgi:hypothetical protein